MIAFLGMIIESIFCVEFSMFTSAKRLVSVETNAILSFLISMSAPFNSNLGLFESIAGVIFLSDSIRVCESIDIFGLPS